MQSSAFAVIRCSAELRRARTTFSLPVVARSPPPGTVTDDTAGAVYDAVATGPNTTLVWPPSLTLKYMAFPTPGAVLHSTRENAAVTAQFVAVYDKNSGFVPYDTERVLAMHVSYSCSMPGGHLFPLGQCHSEYLACVVEHDLSFATPMFPEHQSNLEQHALHVA